MAQEVLAFHRRTELPDYEARSEAGRLYVLTRGSWSLRMYEREGCSTLILDRAKRMRDATAWVNEHINDPTAVQKARQEALKQPTHFYHWLKAQSAERINGQKFDPISFMFNGDTGKTVGDTEQAQVMFTLGYRMNGSKKITKTFISGQYWKVDVDDKPNERDGGCK